MEIAFNPTGTLPSMLCCVCGVVIQQNAANMCVSCVQNTVDITSEISKKVTIHSCRSCGRYLGPPWQSVALESKELMGMCLRKISGLSRVKLIDAVWIWTEPHSMRLKIKVTIQKEVINGAVLQQATIIEFVVRNQQCKACEANFAQGNWHAIVQVRQRVPHKRTFFFLEQLILKHESHMECLKIETFRDGMDFYFFGKNQALRFIEFLNGNVPTRVKYARKLVSANFTENSANYKHNYLVEIVPICKDDLLILPKELARNLSNISRLVLAKRIGAGIHIIDPLSGERSEINTEKYWRNSFKPVMSSRQFTKYLVLSVEPLLSAQRPSAKVGKMRWSGGDADSAVTGTGTGTTGSAHGSASGTGSSNVILSKKQMRGRKGKKRLLYQQQQEEQHQHQHQQQNIIAIPEDSELEHNPTAVVPNDNGNNNNDEDDYDAASQMSNSIVGPNEFHRYHLHAAGASVASASVLGLGGDRKLRLAEVVVARERDMGVNDTQFTCLTHLGNLLKAGDTVLGYDFTVTNWNIDEADSLDKVLDNKQSFPDLVLVRKYHEPKKERLWQLRKLHMEEGSAAEGEAGDYGNKSKSNSSGGGGGRKGVSAAEREAEEEEYEQFMQDVERDPELRSKMNLYKRNHKHSSAPTGKNHTSSSSKGGSSMEVEHVEGGEEALDDDEVRLEELMDDMALLDAEEEEEEEEEEESTVAAELHNTQQDAASFDASSIKPGEMKFL
mmetsp:Transcript_10018/g.16755  ORF Transcript_10018/g.16755 Transcript_10018/m.16755 type:complete len:726 (+) Transcript_10018:51-2228(+)